MPLYHTCTPIETSLKILTHKIPKIQNLTFVVTIEVDIEARIEANSLETLSKGREVLKTYSLSCRSIMIVSLIIVEDKVRSYLNSQKNSKSKIVTFVKTSDINIL